MRYDISYLNVFSFLYLISQQEMTALEYFTQPKPYCRYCNSGPDPAALFPSTQARYQFQLRSGLFCYDEPDFYARPPSQGPCANACPEAPKYYGVNPLIIEDILDLQVEHDITCHKQQLRAANECKCCNYEPGKAIHHDLSRCFPRLA